MEEITITMSERNKELFSLGCSTYDIITKKDWDAFEQQVGSYGEAIMMVIDEGVKMELDNGLY